MSDMPPRPFSAVEDLPTGDPSQQEDYFGFDDSRKFVFPDGKSYIEFKILNEGDRRRFQNSTASDVRLDRSTGNATVRTAAGDQRYELLMAAIVDWNLVRNGGLIPCTKENKGKFLTAANRLLGEGRSPRQPLAALRHDGRRHRQGDRVPPGTPSEGRGGGSGKRRFERQVELFVQGGSVEQPCEAIRLFALCQAMNWCHLPTPGGIYDQKPKLLDQWLYIFHRQHVEEDRKANRQRSEMDQRNRQNRSRSRLK
jgi:hypothetical protein